MIAKNMFPLEGYTPVREIGYGSLGTVYMCEKTDTRESVAVKQIVVESESEFARVREFYDSMNSKDFQHANILPVTGVHYHKAQKDNVYVTSVVMEFSEASLLAEFEARDFKRAVFAEREILYLMYSLLSALLYAKSKRVFHRSLTPHNVMVFTGESQQKQYKITDFDCGKSVRTFSGLKTSTARDLQSSMYFDAKYMPPEFVQFGEYVNSVLQSNGDTGVEYGVTMPDLEKGDVWTVAVLALDAYFVGRKTRAKWRSSGKSDDRSEFVRKNVEYDALKDLLLDVFDQPSNQYRPAYEEYLKKVVAALSDEDVPGTAQQNDLIAQYSAPAPGRANQHSQVHVIEVHSNYGIASVAFSPDGTLLASAGEDSSVRLWNPKTRTQIALLKGHTDRVYCVAFSPDSRLIASASRDSTVRVWSARTDGTAAAAATAADAERESLAELKGHSQIVQSVAFSLNGKLIASASWDKTVKVWDLQEKTLVKTLEGHLGPVFCVAFAEKDTLLVSGAYDCTVRVWDLSADGKQQELFHHEYPVMSVAYAPMTKSVAAGYNNGAVGVWRVGDTDRKLSEKYSFRTNKTGIITLKFAQNGTDLITSSLDGQVIKNKLGSGAWQQQQQQNKNQGDRIGEDSRAPPSETILNADCKYVKSVAVSPNQKQIAFGLITGNINIFAV